MTREQIEKERMSGLLLRTTDTARAIALLEEYAPEAHVWAQPDASLVITDYIEESVVQILHDNAQTILELTTMYDDMTDYFTELMGMRWTMFNFLKADLYRLTRGKAFWVVTIALVAITSLTVWAFQLIALSGSVGSPDSHITLDVTESIETLTAGPSHMFGPCSWTRSTSTL